MNTNRIFLGNLMCDKEFIETTVFLKCKDDIYVKLDDIDSILDIYNINNKKKSLPILSTMKNGYYYIDEDSLIPYYEKQKHKSLKKIKLDVFTDSRNIKKINL